VTPSVIADIINQIETSIISNLRYLFPLILQTFFIRTNKFLDEARCSSNIWIFSLNLFSFVL